MTHHYKVESPLQHASENDQAKVIESDTILGLEIVYEQVITRNISPLIKLLSNHTGQKVDIIVFSGFEEDPREVWEIPEVREYVRLAVTSAPDILCQLSWYARALLRDCLSDHLILGQVDGMVLGLSEISDLWFSVANAAGIDPKE